jgi:L-2-hydroxyglutarate oxidase
MNYDVLLIGSGIVGLATAFKLKLQHPELSVGILEKEKSPAMHQTGNNSGVIHAGIYYKPGSAKAINCRNGYKQLISFCKEEGIPYDICGKLIVATTDKEVDRLDALYERGLENGLVDIRMISSEEIKKYEPHAEGKKAIHVPYTGIVDYKTVGYKLRQRIEKMNGVFHFNQRVKRIKENTDGVELITKTDVFNARFVINTAGLFSDRIAKLTQSKLDVRIIPFRGEYVELTPEKAHLVKNLIYPVPDPDFPFLGVHFTRMIQGGVEAGPNAVWAFKREGYSFRNFSVRDTYESLAWKGFRKVMKKYWRMGLAEYKRSFNKKALTSALQRLIPEITENDIVRGDAGVRAQACLKNGGLVDDFLFDESDRIIHVLNAPSPAATASLAIGDVIVNKIESFLK